MARLALQSSHVDSGEEIARECTCDGDNLSPNLRWFNVPAGTRSLAVVVDDPAASEGLFTHWLVYDISPSVAEIPPGRPAEERIDEGVQGMNDFGAIGYTGPCPPAGEERRYYVRLYALDCELKLGPGADRGALMRAMRGHVIEETELIARYGALPTPV